MNRLLVNLLLLISLNVCAQSGGIYFVAVDGDNNNPGTINQPWATWQKAFDEALPGDTVYIRGGVYYSTFRMGIDPDEGIGNSGTSASPIVYAGYPTDILSGNWPILDCKYHCDSIPPNPWGGTYNSAIHLKKVEYITLKCLEIRNVFQCDSVLNGAITADRTSNITYERIKIHDVGQRGYWHTSGAWSEADSAYAVDVYGSTPSDATRIFVQPDTTRWINCDVWNCMDTLRTAGNRGNGGDAFKTVSYVGNYYHFEGSRAWNYSDDGFDPNGGKRVFTNCWVMSGDKYAGFDGFEGNGFKTSGIWKEIFPFYSEEEYNAIYSDNMIQTVGCLAMLCGGVGFYHGVESDTTLNPIWYNNTSYKNAIGFSTSGFGYDTISDIFRNNIVYKSTSTNAIGWPYDLTMFYNEYEESNNNWYWVEGYPNYQWNPASMVEDADFETVDADSLEFLFTQPREADGSLPDIKPLMLKNSSDLIDGGIDVGTPYCGLGPDLGYSEFDLSSCFNFQDTSNMNSPVDVIYTGNASASATYYWDFGCATVISGSGQGPYVLEWPTGGCDTVSLYVEESNATSNTTAHEIYIIDGSILTSSFKLPETAYVNTPVEVFYEGNASSAATYNWDFGSATILSGSGQGPYTLQWTNDGWHTVSLYVEESGIVSDTTTNDIHLLTNSSITSEFLITQDTLCPKSSTLISYTGNASDTATYYWDFGYATVLSGSGQGPYTVQWPYGGFAAVSLYVEEFDLTSDTTTNDAFVLFDPIFTINPYPNDTMSFHDTIVLTGDIESVSYLWSTGETTKSIDVFLTPPENGEVQNYWLRATNDEGCTYTDTITVWFDMPVQINDFQNEIELKIYPNPVSDYLNVELEIAEHGQYIFEVIDHLGRPVIRELKSFEPGMQKMHLGMNSLSPGIYILSVKSNNGMIGVQKVLKYSNRG